MNASEPRRTGVFVCHCGGNISDVVDVAQAAARVGARPEVAVACTHQFMCSDPGQALLEQSIAEHELDRVVVAACSPSLHLATFRRALTRAGLNPFLLEHVNIREQVSWVVEDGDAATAKAARLMGAAVGRLAYQDPLQFRRIPIHPAALVVGGGVAGMVAALDIANHGVPVTIVEKSPFLGGRMAQLFSLFPTDDVAKTLLTDLYARIEQSERVSFYTNARVVRSEGVVGDFRTTVRVRPRGVAPDIGDPTEALAACPVERPDPFDFGLSRRKALVAPHPAQHPLLPAVDWEACTRCGQCVEPARGKVHLDQGDTEEILDIRAGAVVLATGHDPYEPAEGEFGYQTWPQVITLQQLNRLLDPLGPTRGQVLRGGLPVRRVGFIHCVGARQYEDPSAPLDPVNRYCARTCCTGSLHASLELKKRHPKLKVAHFYRDIRTYGRGHEEYYERASESGVMFVRRPAREHPEVAEDPRREFPLVIRSRDLLTEGIEVEYPVDLVVLSTGVVPQAIEDLREVFHCAQGSDRFLMEVHPKLRPVELAVSGVFLGGCCQSPMDITESCAGASAAASKVAALIAQGEVLMDPYTAWLDEAQCTGCWACLTVCPYDAITKHPDEEQQLVQIADALCTGCGVCVATCPSAALQQHGFSDTQLMAELEALLPSDLATLTA